MKHGSVVEEVKCACEFENQVVRSANRKLKCKRAKSDFENFYKLISNVCFRQTMEQMRKRSIINFKSDF